MTGDPQSAQALAEVRGTRAEHEAISRRFAPVRVLVVAVLAVGGFQANSASGHHDKVAVAILLGVFTVAALGAVVTIGQPARRQAPPVAVLFAASAVLIWLLPGGTADIGLFAAVALSNRLLPARAGAGLAVVSAALVTVSLLASHSSTVSALLSGFAFISLCVILIMAKQLKEGTEKAEMMLAELEQTRGAQAQAAALAERQRLAREMHDVLAHSLSGLMLQLEGARMLAQSNPADPRLPETIERAHHLGQTGLAEARRAIGMLRDEDLPGPEQLADLAAQFERDSGIQCQFAVFGQAHPLDAQARLAVYRVAQEALTNVSKHARTDRVDIQLAYRGDRTCLTIEDFTAAGRPPAASGNGGGGYGLTGMRERAELLGGSLTAGPTGGGFRVELEVPA